MCLHVEVVHKEDSGTQGPGTQGPEDPSMVVTISRNGVERNRTTV